MAEIIITNKRTIRRKLRNLGIPILAVAALYFTQPLIKNILNSYQRSRAYSVVQSEIEDENYLKAREKLANLKNFIEQGKVSELEAKIESVSPDSLLARSQSQDLKGQAKLVQKAHDTFVALEKDPFEADKRYIEFLIYDVKNDLNEKYSGRAEDPIKNKLENIKNHSYFKELVENNRENRRSKVYKPILDDFITSTARYIKTFSDAHRNYNSYFYYPVTALTFSLDISLKLDPTRENQDVKTLIDAYAELTKSLMNNDYNDKAKDVVKTLSKLKDLEAIYKYKNSLLDVDKDIINYSSKL